MSSHYHNEQPQFTGELAPTLLESGRARVRGYDGQLSIWGLPDRTGSQTTPSFTYVGRWDNGVRQGSGVQTFVDERK